MTTECERCSEERWDSGSGCINGDWYEPCESEYCYGMCDYAGKCGCECHDA